MTGSNWDSGGCRKLNFQYFRLSCLVLVLSLCLCCETYLVDTNPYRHVETLDYEGKYILEWMVNWETKRIIFNVTVETKGYIGLGLSSAGKMSGADIVMGGVLPDGKPYFSVSQATETSNVHLKI